MNGEGVGELSSCSGYLEMGWVGFWCSGVGVTRRRRAFAVRYPWSEYWCGVFPLMSVYVDLFK